MRRSAPLLTLALVVTGASTASARQVQLPIPSSVAEMVVVDVYVTDKKGRPIVDLRREDFELREDSRPVEIAAFEGPPPTNVITSQSTPGSAPPPGATDQIGTREALTVALYVDRSLLSPQGRVRALDQAALIAEGHLSQGARVVVIGEDKGLRPLTPLTTDVAVVRAALRRIQGWATQAPGASEGRTVIDQMRSRIEMAETSRECSNEPPCVCVLSDLISMVRGYATFRAIEVQQAAGRLSFLVNALRGIPGRKALIYVSEGLEQRPGVHLFDQITTICPQALNREFTTISAAMQEFETSAVLHEAAARANAARVTFYPIDARGLSGLSSGDIESGDRRYVAAARTDSVKDANLVNQYRLLAEETGGFAMIRGVDPQTSLKRFEADARGHYVLGFVPGEADGRRHTLYAGLVAKVRDKRDAEVRHRQSYVRAASPARRGQRSLSTLLFGLEENTLHSGATVERTGPDSARVKVALSLAALKTVDGIVPPEARVQVVLSFRSADSETSAVVVREKEIVYPITEAELVRDGGMREIVVDVPVTAGAYEFAIGVEDTASGASTYLRRSLPASVAR